MKFSRNLIKAGLLTSLFSLSALGAEGPVKAADAGGPSDAQIAGIVVAANAVDIDAGKFADHKTKNKEVREFAKLMVTDHTAVNKQASDLAKKLKLTPADSDTAKSLKDGGVKNLANLKTLKDKAFDKEYVDHEVVYHQAVLDALDNTLIPSARNAELKTLLEAVRPAIAAHLEHAKVIQNKLASAS